MENFLRKSYLDNRSSTIRESSVDSQQASSRSPRKISPEKVLESMVELK